MVGGRKTRDFPHGTPRLLNVNGIGFVVLGVAAMVYGDSFDGWRRFVPLCAVTFVFLSAHSLLLRHYERTGQAIRRRRKQTVVRFGKRLPIPMLLARASFFVTAVVMLIFGVAPLPDSTARHGIIGCVFALLAVAGLNIGLEQHYVNSSIAQEVDVARPTLDDTNEGRD
jgi:hypothetical protein